MGPCRSSVTAIVTDLRKLVEEGLKRLKLYEKAKARYHWSRWSTWRKDNAPTLLRGLSDLLLELDGLSICVDRKAADLISKDQEIHTLRKERDAYAKEFWKGHW